MENDWHNYDLMDDATHPENAAEVEVQSSDGKTFDIIYSEFLVAIVGKVNSPLSENPPKTEWRRWRYKRAEQSRL